jgi:hypothetical protein
MSSSSSILNSTSGTAASSASLPSTNKLTNSQSVKQNKRELIPTSVSLPSTNKLTNSQSVKQNKRELIPSSAVDEFDATPSIPFLQVEVNDLFPSSMYDPSIDSFKILREKGSFYLSFSEKIHYSSRDEAIELPPVKDCIGVVFTHSDGPIAFDKGFFDMFPKDQSYSIIMQMIGPDYSPMYIVSSEGIFQINSEEFKHLYKDLFGKGANKIKK